MTPAKPLPLVVAGDVDLLAGLEGVGRDLLAEGVVAGVGGAQLDQVPARGDPGRSKWPFIGLLTLRGSISP
jgi:hypothetical protein